MVPEPRSAYALQFFLLATVLLAIAASLSAVMIELLPGGSTSPPNRFSIAFVVSTCMLLSGSWCLSNAVVSVRRERQGRFRRWLKLALMSGTLFVAVQTYALACLMRRQIPGDAESAASSFVAAVSALHGIHFIVALLFLSYVTVQAMADRYDHEYFWGVLVCAWFWHALGIAWLAILFVMLFARFYC